MIEPVPPEPTAQPLAERGQQPAELSWWKRLCDWAHAPSEPPPVRYAETSAELLARLGEPSDEVTAQLK